MRYANHHASTPMDEPDADAPFEGLHRLSSAPPELPKPARGAEPHGLEDEAARLAGQAIELDLDDGCARLA